MLLMCVPPSILQDTIVDTTGTLILFSEWINKHLSNQDILSPFRFPFAMAGSWEQMSNLI